MLDLCCSLSFLFANPDFDGPNQREKKSPLEFFQDITNCFCIIQLPRENNAESKRASKNGKSIKEVLIYLWDDKRTFKETSEFLKSEYCAYLSLMMNVRDTYELTSHIYIQGNKNSVNDWNTVFGFGDNLLVLAVSVAEVKDDKTKS